VPTFPKLSIFLGDFASWRELETSRDGQILKHDFSSRQDAKSPRAQVNQSLCPQNFHGGFVGESGMSATKQKAAKAAAHLQQPDLTVVAAIADSNRAIWSCRREGG
jgi:hypothetical protein